MDLAIRPRILILVTLPWFLWGCTTLVTPGTTSEPASRPDIEGTVTAAVAATVTAAAGTPRPGATPDPEPTATANVQATVEALLSTPAVPVSTPGQTLVASQHPAAAPLATAVPTATVVPTAPLRPTATLSPVRTPAPGAGLSSSTGSGETISRIPAIPPTSIVAPTATVALQATPTPLPATPTPALSCQPVADGTVVTAWIDGTQAASDSVENSQFALIIEQPDSAYYVDEIIAFKIGDLGANETAIWEPGGAEILDLTATAMPRPDPTPSPLSPASRGFTSSGLLAQLLPPHVVIGAAAICSAPLTC